MSSNRIRDTEKKSKNAIRALAAHFHRRGYIRRQNRRRLSWEGYLGYKKGDEVRLIASSTEELEEIRRLLKLTGFKPGRPFRKAAGFCQPVYGREAVARFQQLVGKGGSVTVPLTVSSPKAPASNHRITKPRRTQRSKMTGTVSHKGGKRRR